MNRLLLLFQAISLVLFAVMAECEEKLALAPFVAEITPPVGSPLCFSYIKPVKTMEEPLTARGIVLLGSGKPIVLCVADYVVIANESHDRWKEAIAEAAGTDPNRVAIHVLHNHDAPGYDLSAMKQLKANQIEHKMALESAHDEAIEATVQALRVAIKNPRPLTHVSTGKAEVEKFASNRRILGENGKVKITRFSASRNPKAIAAPEGVIDPELDMLVFWNHDQAIAALSFYASHPQSYYGRGGVTPDTVGLARNRRTDETGVLHIHFDGAGGNIAAGKYNNGSEEARRALTRRIETALATAWDSQTRFPVSASDVTWTFAPTEFPWRGLYTEQQLTDQIADEKTPIKNRIRAARDLVFYQRWKEGHKININHLEIKKAHLLFFPGELFVEYQLWAKAMLPNDFVTVAAYGDGGPGYIGTAIAYQQGGYEVSRVSLTAPTIETILKETTRSLIERE